MPRRASSRARSTRPTDFTLPARSRRRHGTVSPVASGAWLVDLLLPDRCVSCGSSGGPLCAVCRASFRPIAAPLCARCGAPTAWPVERCRECSGRRLGFVSARAPVVYQGSARALVRAWKERGLRRAASLAAETVVARLPAPAADVITYIPPDADRVLLRGVHPAQALAHELAVAWGLEPAALLRRRAATGRQTGLRREARLVNVRGAFAAHAAPPARVVLVDDVYTTGATTSAAAAALRRAGAHAVQVVTFARTVR